MFRLYTSNCIGNVYNCTYCKQIEVTDKQSLIEAVSHDYVPVLYKDNHRDCNSFIESNCIVMDCDNTHSDNPSDWVNVSDVRTAFTDVSFAVHYSRNHMREKDGRTARPKFHILFPIDNVCNAQEYKDMKDKTLKVFSFFDEQAVDNAHFFFGTVEPEVEIISGTMNLSRFIEAHNSKDSTIIPVGSRNSTMLCYADRVLKRYGDTEEAFNLYTERARQCEKPLDASELHTIWENALRFYSQISATTGYISPAEYNKKTSLEPEGDYTDVGQAYILAREYSDILRHSKSTGFIVYNGSYWEESESKAQNIALQLTDRQLQEANSELQNAKSEMDANGTLDILLKKGEKKALEFLSQSQLPSFERYTHAQSYKKFIDRRRAYSSIEATLNVVKSKLSISPDELDRNGFLLNTPSYTYDLNVGLEGCHAHSYTDFITKQTAVDPSDEGADVWLNALDLFFCSDEELITYVQEVVGIIAIGKVFDEFLVIAYGDGLNGKSTFWNTIAKVLGTYSGHLSSEALTMNCNRNIKPEIAEAKNKRILIAGELEEGAKLNSSVVKQLCSTDAIWAEKKFYAPFAFEPTHTLVLYTNHLPKVNTSDYGTWRRLKVIPFNATIEQKQDIKNYSAALFEQAGGAILTWIIQGAQRAIKKQFKIEPPEVVRQAIDNYRNDNDWMFKFINDCCDKVSLDEPAVKPSELFNAYCNYCRATGEAQRSSADFYSRLKSVKWIERKEAHHQVKLRGIRIKEQEQTSSYSISQ